MTRVYKGQDAVKGIVIGKIMNVAVKLESRLYGYRASTIDEEIKKYHAAYKNATKDIWQTINSAKEKGMKEQIGLLLWKRIKLFFRIPIWRQRLLN